MKARLYSLLQTTSYSFEYSCILFLYFRSVEEHLKALLRAPGKNNVLHSACAGASGSSWNDRCGCSEYLSWRVMTSEPFYILWMWEHEIVDLVKMQNSVYAKLGVLGVCCSYCQLLSMIWRDSEGWLDFMFRCDTRVVDHQQKTFPSGQYGSVRVDALRQSRQRHPGFGLLIARCQCHESHCISPSDCCFAISSRSVSLQF